MRRKDTLGFKVLPRWRRSDYGKRRKPPKPIAQRPASYQGRHGSLHIVIVRGPNGRRMLRYLTDAEWQAARESIPEARSASGRLTRPVEPAL